MGGIVVAEFGFHFAEVLRERTARVGLTKILRDQLSRVVFDDWFILLLKNTWVLLSSIVLRKFLYLITIFSFKLNFPRSIKDNSFFVTFFTYFLSVMLHDYKM